MFKRLITTALVFGMAATGPPPAAQAQINCGPRETIIAQLKANHGETLLGFGLAGPLAAYEVWRQLKTGSWSILMTRADNISCIMAAGRHWMEITRPPTIAAKAAIKQ